MDSTPDSRYDAENLAEVSTGNTTMPGSLNWLHASAERHLTRTGQPVWEEALVRIEAELHRRHRANRNQEA